MKNILVAIDKQRHADRLISEAVKLAKLSGAKIWVLHVTEPDPDSFRALEAGPQFLHDKRLEDRRKEAAFVKQRAEEIVEREGIVAEGVLIQGALPGAIIKKVEEHHIDLIVAGHQRKNLLYDLFAANTKKDLIDELRIPLLAVPLEAERERPVL